MSQSGTDRSSVNNETPSTLSPDGYDSSFDKTDQKISARATLQTPSTRTSLPDDEKVTFEIFCSHRLL